MYILQPTWCKLQLRSTASSTSPSCYHTFFPLPSKTSRSQTTISSNQLHAQPHPFCSATSNRHKRREPQGALYAEVCFFRCHLKLLGKNLETCQRGIQERSMRYQGDRGSGSSKTRARKKHKQSPQGCNKPTITCCDSTPCS